MKPEDSLSEQGTVTPKKLPRPATHNHPQPTIPRSITSSDQSVAADEHPVAILLSERNIRKIVIIDDIFDDDIPPLEAFNDSDLAEFYLAVEEDEGAAAEAIGLFANDNIRAMTYEQLQILWRSLDKYPALKRQVDHWLAPTIYGYKTELNILCKQLRNSLKLEVECLGQMAPVESVAADLIFLDRRLGPETVTRNVDFLDQGAEVSDSNDAPVRAAEQKARELYEAYRTRNIHPPLIVLMSSKPVSAKDEDNFINNALLLGGMFHFVPKHDLQNEVAILLLMGQFALAWPIHHEMQSFYEALNVAAEKAKKEFTDASRQLRVQDYTYIQHLSLQKEGYPLGDYMLWLFSSYFGHLLRAQPGLQAAQGEIDKKMA